MDMTVKNGQAYAAYPVDFFLSFLNYPTSPAWLSKIHHPKSQQGCGSFANPTCLTWLWEAAESSWGWAARPAESPAEPVRTCRPRWWAWSTPPSSLGLAALDPRCTATPRCDPCWGGARRNTCGWSRFWGSRSDLNPANKPYLLWWCVRQPLKKAIQRLWVEKE